VCPTRPLFIPSKNPRLDPDRETVCQKYNDLKDDLDGRSPQAAAKLEPSNIHFRADDRSLTHPIRSFPFQRHRRTSQIWSLSRVLTPTLAA
jgi:hypothetical protein